jgi:hypothetical protein
MLTTVLSRDMGEIISAKSVLAWCPAHAEQMFALYASNQLVGTTPDVHLALTALVVELASRYQEHILAHLQGDEPEDGLGLRA